MPRPFSLGAVEIDAGTRTETLPYEPEAETPFRIAIFGDFSGRANRGIFDPGSPSRRRAVEIDRDNFDEVLAQFAPKLQVLGRSLTFRSLDDFHPDQLYDLIEKPVHPASFRAAAPERPVSLDDMLAETEIRQASPDDPFAAYLDSIVKPHLTPKPDLEAEGQANAAISAEMRSLLHQPDFQALEAAWRGVYFLVRTLETGALLRISLVDATKAELDVDPKAIGLPGEEPWAVLAGNYTFGPTLDDADLLRRIARVAAEAGAPFLAAASPRLLGCESLADSPYPADWNPQLDPEAEEAWEILRRTPEASYLGLALPRFLLRPPYGKGINSTERFDFEEMPPGAPPHESYLWTNPIFACVFLLGTAFSEYGWSLRPGVFQEIEDMPAHFYNVDGEIQMKPCAETFLTMDAAEKILDAGFMPLLSIKARDAIRLARFQSIKKPPAPLSGSWR